jgi:sn-glycerol 3-phosphate transport system ATP-binding protein
LPAGAGQERILGVRPEHLLPILDGSAAQLSLDVELVEALGAELLVHARCGGQALVLRCPANVPVSTGQRIGASFGAGMCIGLM